MNEVLLRRLLGALVLFGGLFVLSLLLPDVNDRPTIEPDDGRQTVRIDLLPEPERPISAPRPLENPAPEPVSEPKTNHQAADPALTQDTNRPAPSAAQQPKSKARPEPVKPQLPAPAKSAKKNPPVQAKPAVSAKQWWVQVASFGSMDNARRLQDRLQKSALSARLETVISGARTLHRVIIGPFSSSQSAEAARGQAILLGFPDSRLYQQ